jgi:hypothetical protein
MYLDGSRMIHERACAVGVENQFYTFQGAPHVPYAGNSAYMDTTVNFFRDFLIKQLGCTDAILQPENAPAQAVNLYAANYCDGSPVDEVCPTSSISEENLFSALIYPNPVINIFSISGFNDIETIELYSMEGKLIQQIDKHNNSFDISHLSRSNYLVKFSANNQIFYMKLMKY